MRFANLVLTTLLAVAASQVQAQVVLTIDAPGVQASTVSGVTTENFSGFAPGQYTTLNSSIGTYTSPGMEVVAANQYGGAGGSGNYFSVGAQSGHLTSTLTLKQDAGYFGFWFSAGDAQNKIELYENSTLEYTLNTAGLINFINMAPHSNAYFGNPNNGQDAGQPFAYVNFFGTNGTLFNKIVFSNLSTGTGFESDNHSVGPTSPVSGITVTPEPGSFAMLMGMGLSGAGGFFARRRKQARKAA